jgi:hypothetical protein
MGILFVVAAVLFLDGHVFPAACFAIHLPLKLPQNNQWIDSVNGRDAYYKLPEMMLFFG